MEQIQLVLAGEYVGETPESIMSQFDVEIGYKSYNQGDHGSAKRDGFHMVFAYHDDESYSGYAFILGFRDGQLVEINGSHCSCHGFEGQWEEEPVTIEALRHRMTKGDLGKTWDTDTQGYNKSEFADELESLLVTIESAA